jgi:hypothetical protein
VPLTLCPNTLTLTKHLLLSVQNLEAAIARTGDEKIDLVVVDTAGRLHTAYALMEEVGPGGGAFWVFMGDSGGLSGSLGVFLGLSGSLRRKNS